MPAKDLIFTVLGIDRASNVFDDVGKSMDRASKVGTKSMAAMLGASLAASAGIAAALGGVSIVFAATAAAALSQNAEVANSFRDLGQSMKTGLVADAGVLEDEMVGAATDINSAFQELRPQLREAFSAAQPYIDNLTDGVTGFARGAMPGMVTAVKSAGPVMDGLERLMVSAGLATGDFFEVISKGSPGAGAALEDLGDLVEGILPDVGQMLVNLSGLWVEHGDQTVRVITRIVDVVTDLSSTALPTLSDGVGVALDVLDGLLNVIEPMSGILGPLIGLWVSLSTALKGMTFVSGVVDKIGTSVRNMGEKFDAAPGRVGKFKAAVGGALNLLGGPWGIAVAGATAILALFGDQSQRTAQDQRSLADALRQSGGEFDAEARRTLRSSQQYQDLSKYIKDAGLSERDYLDAVIEGGPALEEQQKRLAELASGQQVANARSGEARSKAEAQAEAARQLHYKTEDLRATIIAAQEDFAREQAAIGGVTASMAGALPGADSLAESISVLGDKTATAAEHADALNNAWRELLGIPLTLEESTAAFEGSLDSFVEAMNGAKASTDNWRTSLVSADGQINVSTEAGRQLSANLIQVGEDYRTLAQTAYDTTLQRTGSEQQATAAAVAAAQQRRDQFIAEATQITGNAALAQMLADRYLGLPDDVLTLIRADAGNAQGIVDGFVSRNDGRTVTVRVNAVTNYRSPDGGYAGRAIGGPVLAGQIYKVGEHGEELFMAPSDGEIIPTGQTRRFLSGLRANAGMSARSAPDFAEPSSAGAAVGEALRTMAAAGWLGGAQQQRRVVELRPDGSELSSWLMRTLREAVRDEGGDVQLVLGSR